MSIIIHEGIFKSTYQYRTNRNKGENQVEFPSPQWKRIKNITPEEYANVTWMVIDAYLQNLNN